VLVEKALDDIFWQPVQWQAMVSIGGPLTAIVTRPHRQAPLHGRLGWVMAGWVMWAPLKKEVDR
jgi:hypothetical protein